MTILESELDAAQREMTYPYFISKVTSGDPILKEPSRSNHYIHSASNDYYLLLTSNELAKYPNMDVIKVCSSRADIVGWVTETAVESDMVYKRVCLDATYDYNYQSSNPGKHAPRKFMLSISKTAIFQHTGAITGRDLTYKDVLTAIIDGPIVVSDPEAHNIAWKLGNNAITQTKKYKYVGKDNDIVIVCVYGGWEVSLDRVLKEKIITKLESRKKAQLKRKVGTGRLTINQLRDTAFDLARILRGMFDPQLSINIRCSSRYDALVACRKMLALISRLKWKVGAKLNAIKYARENIVKWKTYELENYLKKEIAEGRRKVKIVKTDKYDNQTTKNMFINRARHSYELLLEERREMRKIMKLIGYKPKKKRLEAK